MRLCPVPDTKRKRRDKWGQAAGTLHFKTEFRLTSQALAACRTVQCIGGRVWPSFFPRDLRWEKSLCLWANTTLGLMGHWWVGSHQHNGQSIVSKESLRDLPVLDCRKLTDGQLDPASKACSTTSGNVPSGPPYEAWRDPVRRALGQSRTRGAGCRVERGSRRIGDPAPAVVRGADRSREQENRTATGSIRLRPGRGQYPKNTYRGWMHGTGVRDFTEQPNPACSADQ